MVEKKSPTWSDVKARLAEFNRTNLLALVNDLYCASKDNQAFLHARFDLGADALRPYKIRIERWLSPDLRKNQNVSASKAKRAIIPTALLSDSPGIERSRYRGIKACCETGSCHGGFDGGWCIWNYWTGAVR